MSGLRRIYSAIGRLIRPLRRSARKTSPAVAAVTTPVVSTIPETSGIHPGLTDQQLVVLLTAAACEAMGGLVRIEKIRYLPGKNWNWVTQGRSELHTHRLK